MRGGVGGALAGTPMDRFLFTSSISHGTRDGTDRWARIGLPGGAKSSAIRTPAERLAMLASRIWAWLFLALMVLFFVVTVPLVSSGTVQFLTIRNSQNILVAI